MKLTTLLILAAHLFKSGICQCSFYSDSYAAQWSVEGSGKNTAVRFSLQVTVTKPDFWTGIGFGPSMRQGDYSIVKVRNGAAMFLDMYSDKNERPHLDTVSDLVQLSVSVDDGKLYANFSRPLGAQNQNEDVSLEGCQTFMFPVKPGIVEEVTGQLLIHAAIPSKLQYCNIATRCRSTNLPTAASSFSAVVPIQQAASPTPKFYKVNPVQSSNQTQKTPDLPRRRVLLPSPVITEKGREKKQAASSTQSQNQATTTTTSCSYQSGDYSVEWNFEPTVKMVSMKIRAKNDQQTNWWTGIGFGRSMTQADFVVITVVNGQLTISDRNSNELNPRSEPLVDNQVNVQFLSGQITDGLVDVSFSRPLKSPDISDKSLEDASLNGGCQYFMFPTSGGPIHFDGRLGKHTTTPQILLVCQISQCYPGGRGSTISDPSKGPPPSPQQKRAITPSFPNNKRCTKRDNVLCRPYFDQYLTRVDEYAARNGHAPRSQYSQACNLLWRVQGGIISQECCALFKEICSVRF